MSRQRRLGCWMYEEMGGGIEQARAILDGTLAGRIQACARRVGVSAASVRLALFLIMCAWQISQRRQDVVFGDRVVWTHAGGGMGADRVMGLFINTLPVRILVGEQGSEECVRATHRLMADLLHVTNSLTVAGAAMQRGAGSGSLCLQHC